MSWAKLTLTESFDILHRLAGIRNGLAGNCFNFDWGGVAACFANGTGNYGWGLAGSMAGDQTLVVISRAGAWHSSWLL